MASNAEKLISQLNNLSSNGALQHDGNARAEALKLSKQLSATLEEPATTALELAYAPMMAMCARVAVDLDLLGAICAQDTAITAAELSQKTGAEELLIVRIMRTMVGLGFAKEVGVETYEPTPISRVMGSSPMMSAHRYMWDCMLGMSIKAPEYFKSNKYICPQDPKDGFLQHAFQTKQTIFEYMASRPEVQSDFDNFMGHVMGGRKDWMAWFPVEEILLHGYVGDLPLIVDVGGGKGHDLQAFHARFPGKGRLVLQDLPVVISRIKDLDPAIERMTYDFFTEQPIKGARAYHFHHIFHDWSDTFCLTMLQQVRPAMKPGYSKLLIQDLILPDTGASAFQGVFDMSMMAFNGGVERSEKQWTALLDQAGFQVIKFWYPEHDGDGVVEATLKA